MAKSKTPAKRARKAEENRLRNAANKSAMKTAIKRFEAALASKDLELAQEKLKKAISVIDKNAVKGIIHRNTAARKKSRLAKRFKSAAGTD
ncbi:MULTISPECIES: 30S ribosomal protein S20 [Syntrophothermus]|uniref:Small ribosomal subunit protein bS20 n=1 Tax=Syntrophothermus lipocalidus (strain DSM 12680 / TGB-C1) TaxID=643648 RepID=D7CNY3_SYNLT|nr:MULTISPECIES: 30S ribosomal protein S20 [Syntrophothermus]ADI02418.1 ribosomal protein S20 [Syntrophothermus lipocalidus DSM 12680]NSW83284.1 30S ribosomal protein S20 [Syntrophothermus sp.]HOV42510.1 30S ribosomal protein S20 [Syntrophothermus lipocalidus]